MGAGYFQHLAKSQHSHLSSWQGLYDAYCAASPPALPACTVDDLRGAKGDFRDWKNDDPRFTTLRRAGHAWKAMLLECALHIPADLKGWSIETLPGTEQNADNLLALALWAKAHLMARLAPPAAAVCPSRAFISAPRPGAVRSRLAASSRGRRGHA